MKILIAAIGKIKGSYLEKSAMDYEKRLKKYYPSNVMELKDLSELSNYLKSGDFIVGCDEKGAQMDSIKFSKWIEKKLSSFKRIVFVIGGADGLLKFRGKCQELLSFSKFTLQHDLARVVLLEQLYRASTILNGGPYHRS